MNEKVESLLSKKVGKAGSTWLEKSVAISFIVRKKTLLFTLRERKWTIALNTSIPFSSFLPGHAGVRKVMEFMPSASVK